MNNFNLEELNNKQVTVKFSHRPTKDFMSHAVTWRDEPEAFTLFRCKLVKNDDMWLLANNFIGNPKLRVTTDPLLRGGYNHLLELTPSVLSHITSISENRNI